MVTGKQNTPNFLKNDYFLPLIHTRTCAYQGVRNVYFSENFALLSCKDHILRFTLCLITNVLYLFETIVCWDHLKSAGKLDVVIIAE